ncbi:class I SAM-dependent methyltransferase [soil metagenome]
MNSSQINHVSEAFSRQASTFDNIEEHNEILQWMRKQIHAHCMRHFKKGNQILELNCGTGIDAVFFAEQGMKVHATDIAAGMLNELRKKIEIKNLGKNISLQQCSFTELHNIEQKNFDHIFSDFGGLNCVKEIDKVIASFTSLLKPGGTVTLVIMPPVCPWEMLLAMKGNFKTAFRRLKKGGAESHLEGEHFMSYYFSPQYIISCFGKEYKKMELQGLGSVVPPPYLHAFPKKHPLLFRQLKKWDEKLCHTFPFNRWADHFILTMKLKSSKHV